MKIVINKCFGGFGLSAVAFQEYCALKGLTPKEISVYQIPRDDPVLVELVERLGAAAYGSYADLKVVEIPDGVDWFIDEYDGNEHIAEQHRTWY